MNDNEVVRVRGLRKSYGKWLVLEGLDLDVHAGEVVGLIGANGAGKTTTVECIQGLRRPDAGEMRILGLDPMTQAEQFRPSASAPMAVRSSPLSTGSHPMSC